MDDKSQRDSLPLRNALEPLIYRLLGDVLHALDRKTDALLASSDSQSWANLDEQSTSFKRKARSENQIKAAVSLVELYCKQARVLEAQKVLDMAMADSKQLELHSVMGQLYEWKAAIL